MLKALQTEKGIFEHLLETAPDAMIIVEKSGSIALVNSQAERLFGYERGELSEKRSRFFFRGVLSKLTPASAIAIFRLRKFGRWGQA